MRIHLSSSSNFSDPEKESYIVIEDYISDVGLPLGVAISLFAGEKSCSKKLNDSFKSGSFQIKDMKTPAIIKDIVVFLKKNDIEISTNSFRM